MENRQYQCCVLTYAVPHRKTYDALCLLKARGYRDVLVWAVPLSYRKNFVPIFEHRPPVLFEVEPKDLCLNLGYEYVLSESGYQGLDAIVSCPVLVCGAGLIPLEFTRKLRLINAHPGYIPLVRGLDAFKWAIHENLPLGVTTHFIGDEIDAGDVIDRQDVPVFANDTFHSVADRAYALEIKMLVEALSLKKAHHVSGSPYPVRRRMPREIEYGLMEDFERYKRCHAQ